MLVVTRAGSPLRSVQDIVTAAKANPGKLNLGTINPGSTQNLAAELFTSTAGIKATIVPFRTSPDMAGAVLRGDVDVAFEFYAAVSGLLTDKNSSRWPRPARPAPPIYPTCRPWLKAASRITRSPVGTASPSRPRRREHHCDAQ